MSVLTTHGQPLQLNGFDNMKQVIFVGSTAYSGSTFLDLTLAHDKAGFSCGEVNAFFFPTRPHHINPNCAAFPKCSCSRNKCKIWQSLNKNGPDHLYQSIFDHFPDVDFIVDSSKDPFWIAEQNERLGKAKIAVKNIAIWKSPLEIAISFSKRKQENKWEKSWVSYYRNFDTLLGENWRAVRYKDFVKDPETLQQLCRVLNISNFPGKEQYWRKYPYYTLFGNHSAIIHLNDDIENYTEIADANEEVSAGSSHRSIYYREASDIQLQARVEKRMQKSRYIQSICKLLEERDIKNENYDPGQKNTLVKRTRASILIRKCKRVAVNTTCRLTLPKISSA